MIRKFRDWQFWYLTLPAFLFTLFYRAAEAYLNCRARQIRK